MPGKIVSISGADELRSGRVSFNGVLKEVNLACVPGAKEGDYVLVHVGFAISIIDEAEASRTLECFKQIGEIGEIAEFSSEVPAGPNKTESS